MRCRRIEKQLVEFAEGRLPASEAQQVQHHLERCERCAQALREVEQAGNLTRLAPTYRAPAGFTEKVAARVRGLGQPSRPLVPRWATAVAAAALVALIGVGGLLVGRRESPPGGPPSTPPAAQEELEAFVDFCVTTHSALPETSGAGDPTAVLASGK